MPPTRVDEVVTALVDLLRTASGVQVLDGPTLGEVLFETIVVGFTDDPQSAPYDTTVTAMSGVGRPRYREDWEVRCLLSITHGDGDLAELRTRAAQVLTLTEDALADTHVAAAWQRARLGSQAQWFPLHHEDGATVNVLFSVAGSSLL